MDYYTYLGRWNKIKDEAKSSPDLYKRDAYLYLEEMKELIEIGLAVCKPSEQITTPMKKLPPLVAKKKSAPQSKKRKR